MGNRGSAAVALALACVALPARAQAVDDQRFELSLHARATRASARAEQAAWLSLTVPLERLAAPRHAHLAAAPPADVAEQQAPAPEAVAGEDAAAEHPPSAGFEQLRALAELSRRAAAVALAVAGAAAERRRLDGLSSRSRASAALPEVRLRARRSTDQALRWAPTNDDPYRVTQADGAGTTLEASATFRLDRLLFSREELTVERLRAQAGASRLKLEQRVREAVLGLYRSRELACGASEEARALPHRLRLVELFTELDALTAGWFAERAPALGRAIWGFPEAVLGACRPAPAAQESAATNPVASLPDSE